MKTCPACRQKLSPAAFNDSARCADGLARVCRACTNARRRQRNRGRTKRPADNLAAALRQGDIKRVGQLVRVGAKPHWCWVVETMRNGHVDLGKKLLASHVERNIFTMAAMSDVAGVRRRLRRTPADARLSTSMAPSSVNVTPLHVACSSDWRKHDRMPDQVAVAEILTSYGADVDARARYHGIDDATPLFCACWTSGNLALVRWLLDHGAVPTESDLRAAIGHFQRHKDAAYDIAEVFIEAGVPVDGSTPGDRTLLQAFAHHAARKTVAWLLAHGAKVNARGPGGRTAAHLAAERNTGPATLALLVKHGADLSVRDDDGRTPLDLARLNGKERIVRWIKAQRAKS